jgi:hypothetical protein
MKTTLYPFAHEVGVFIPGKDQIFITSNRIHIDKNSQRVQIPKISHVPQPTQIVRWGAFSAIDIFDPFYWCARMAPLP